MKPKPWFLVSVLALGVSIGLAPAAEDGGNAQEAAASVFRRNPKQDDPALELARLRNEGIALYESGIALDDALAAFEAAFKLSNATADAFNVATVHYKRNDVATTQEWLDKVLAIDPRMPNALYLKGVLARAEGNLVAARDFWERTREVAPDDGHLHYQLALIARSERDEAAFLQSLVNALALEPDNTAALYQMSRYYQTSGNKEMAKEIWERFNAIKKQEKFSRKEKTKDPSRLSQPVPAPTEAATGFTLIDVAPDYRVAPVRADCHALAADRYAVVRESSPTEHIAVACDDGRLLRLGPDGVAPLGKLPESTWDLYLEWLDDQGARVVTLGPDGLDMADTVAGTSDGGWRSLLAGATRPLVLADLDADGDIDIAAGGGVAPLTNTSELGFKQEVLHQTGPLPTMLDGAENAAVADLNQDGLSDILTLHANGLAIAVGTPDGLAEPIRFVQGSDAEALVSGDFDNTGRLDLALSIPGAVRVLWDLDVRAEPGEAKQQDIALPGAPSVAMTATDYNNDGLLDLVAVAEDGSATLLRSGGRRRLQAMALGIWPKPAANARLLPIDIDSDGREDLAYVGDDGKLAIATNATTGGGNAIALLVNGVRAAPSGRLTQIEVRRGGRYGYYQAAGAIQRVGIGQADYVEILRLQWTNGFVENKLKIDVVPTPYVFTESERISGSCPSLFVWNGERFDYLTDAFISGPMGVPLDRGIYFPVKDRELILIPGERVVLRDGRLDIRFTEELHETVFLDRARLYVVDHAEDTEILPHSRLAPTAPVSELFYTAKQPVAAVAARGSNGADLTATLAAADGEHARFAPRSVHSGFAAPHWIEFELPPSVDPTSVDAVLASGWFYYFESTSMIAEAQRSGPNLPWPWIDQFVDGSWQEVAPLGVPSGKDKTVVAPVAGKLRSHRLRIRSGISTYWDRVAFSFGETEAPASREAPLAESTLRFHGFSRLIAHDPERFDYHAVRYSSMWSPMRGLFTAYGSTAGLVNAADGRYAVFGSGDEISFSFEVGEPAPAGSIRSYLLEFVGYVKDGDRYTGHAGTVEPMPYLGLDSYPPPQDERLIAAQEHSPFRTRAPLNFTLDTTAPRRSSFK